MPIDDADRKRIVQATRTYIARERISREEFARRVRGGIANSAKRVVQRDDVMITVIHSYLLGRRRGRHRGTDVRSCTSVH
jgi:hypothetical protein